MQAKGKGAAPAQGPPVGSPKPGWSPSQLPGALLQLGEDDTKSSGVVGTLFFFSKIVGAQLNLQCHHSRKAPAGTALPQVHTQESLLGYQCYFLDRCYFKKLIASLWKQQNSHMLQARSI